MNNTIRIKFLMLVLLSLLPLSACGSSSGGGGTNSVPVTLNFQMPEARRMGLLSKASPTNVSSLEITANGEGMTEIKREKSALPGEFVSETFDVPIGFDRIFSILIFDPSGNAIYGGQSEPTRITPTEFTHVAILLRPLLLNIPSELPKLSENYLMLDVVGVSSFVEATTSTNYSTTTGIASLKREKAASFNYSLR